MNYHPMTITKGIIIKSSYYPYHHFIIEYHHSRQCLKSALWRPTKSPKASSSSNQCCCSSLSRWKTPRMRRWMPKERSKHIGGYRSCTISALGTSSTLTMTRNKFHGSCTTSCWGRSTQTQDSLPSGRKLATRSCAAYNAWWLRIQIIKMFVSVGCPRPIWKRESWSCARIVGAGDVPAATEVSPQNRLNEELRSAKW